MQKKIKSGQNLIEAIIALGIFFLFMTGTAILLFRSLDTLQKSKTLMEVKSIVEETFEVLEYFSYKDWSILSPGTYGLTFSSSSNQWSLLGSSDLYHPQYTRVVTISSVERDSSCNLVQSGGTIDPDSKNINLSITYDDKNGSQSQEFSRHFTAWDAPTNCIATTTPETTTSTPQGEAGHLVLDVTMSTIDATKKSLVGTTVKNTGSVPIVIDKMTITWTGASDPDSKITYIKINGSNYWHSTNGTGSPQGAQHSGTELNLVDFTLEPGISYPINTFRFDEKVDGATFTLNIKMRDGTTITEVTSPPFVP